MGKLSTNNEESKVVKDEFELSMGDLCSEVLLQLTDQIRQSLEEHLQAQEPAKEQMSSTMSDGTVINLSSTCKK